MLVNLDTRYHWNICNFEIDLFHVNKSYLFIFLNNLNLAIDINIET